MKPDEKPFCLKSGASRSNLSVSKLQLWRFISLAAFITTLTLCSPLACSAADGGFLFSAAEGFSFRVPDGWKEIPRERLTSGLKDAQKTLPNMSVPAVSYGFQSAVEDAPIGFPRLLISVKRIRGLTETDMKSMQEAIQKLQIKADQNFKGNTIGTEPIIESIEFDAERKMLRVISKFRLPDAVTLRSSDSSFATSEGLVSFVFTTKESDFEGFKPIIATALSSVHFGSRLPPNPKDPNAGSEPGRNWEDGVIKVLVLAFIAVFIGAYKAAQKRRKSNDKPERR